MTRAEAIAALWSPPCVLPTKARAIVAALLACGEGERVIVARFCDVSAHSGVDPQALRRLKARALSAPVLVWTRGTVGVDVDMLNRSFQSAPFISTVQNDRSFQSEAFIMNGGTTVATHAGVTSSPTGTTSPTGEETREHSAPVPGLAPPPGGGPGPIDAQTMSDWRRLVGAGAAPLRRMPEQAIIDAWTGHPADVVREAIASLVDWSTDRGGRTVQPRWLAERCERIAASRQPEPPAGGGVAVSAEAQPLVDALAARAPMSPQAAAKVAALVAGESAEVVKSLVRKVEGVDSVRSPAAFVAWSMADAQAEAVKAEAERVAREKAQREQDARLAALREHEHKMSTDTDYRAQRQADARRLAALVEGMADA